LLSLLVKEPKVEKKDSLVTEENKVSQYEMETTKFSANNERDDEVDIERREIPVSRNLTLGEDSEQATGTDSMGKIDVEDGLAEDKKADETESDLIGMVTEVESSDELGRTLSQKLVLDEFSPNKEKPTTEKEDRQAVEPESFIRNLDNTLTSVALSEQHVKQDSNESKLNADIPANFEKFADDTADKQANNITDKDKDSVDLKDSSFEGAKMI